MRGFLTVIPALWLGACAGDAAPPDSAGPSFDTLANGSVLVTNPARGLWDANPAERWRVVEGLRIGTASGEGPESFGSVGSVVVTEAGSLWIVDRLANEIRVFDAVGEFVRTVGRSGEGPGELGSIGQAHRAPNGEIWVEDTQLGRFEIFDTTGTRIGGHRGVSMTRGGFSGWTEDGRFLLSEYDRDSERSFTRAFRLDSEGLLSPAGVVEPPEMELPERQLIVFEYPNNVRIDQFLPHARSTWFARGRGTDWWLVCGHCGESSYDIIRMSTEGDTRLTIRRHYEPTAIPDSVRAAALEPLERYVEGASRITPRFSVDDVPRLYPPFERGFRISGDGTLWLRKSGPGGVAFDIFDREGRYLGQPELPPGVEGMWIRSITDKAIYATDDDELDVDYVVRLDIVRPGSG